MKRRQPAARPSHAQTPGSATLAVQPRALLEKYCVSCHNEKLKTAELMLDPGATLTFIDVVWLAGGLEGIE